MQSFCKKKKIYEKYFPNFKHNEKMWSTVYWTFHRYLLLFIKMVTLQVLVVIDAKPKDLGLPTEAYIAVEEVHDVSLVQYYI